MGTQQHRRTAEAVASARVTGIVGALLGAILAAVIGAGSAWLIFVGGGVGGTVGYWSNARRSGRDRGPARSQRRRRRSHDSA